MGESYGLRSSSTSMDANASAARESKRNDIQPSWPRSTQADMARDAAMLNCGRYRPAFAFRTQCFPLASYRLRNGRESQSPLDPALPVEASNARLRVDVTAWPTKNGDSPRRNVARALN